MENKLNVKNLINVLLKVALAIFLFISLNLVFMPKYIESNEDGRITPEYYREKTPIDVVFTGSSLVQAGVSPMSLYRDYGIASYDRSNSSQTIALSYYMIEDAIKRNKPELVVADVGFMYESADYCEEPSTRKSLDGMKWSKTKVNAINAMMGEDEHFIDYAFPILRFHSRWNDLKTEDFKYIYYKPNVTRNGQLMKSDSLTDYYEYNPYRDDESSVICDENLFYLQKICDICKENDVQLFMMKMPHIQGNWTKKYDEQILEIAQNNNVQYVNFIDLFDAFHFDYMSDFYDSQHMNSMGAEKFSKLLGAYIKKNYTVSDRRNDEKVKAIFDKKLELYENDMK